MKVQLKICCAVCGEELLVGTFCSPVELKGIGIGTAYNVPVHFKCMQALRTPVKEPRLEQGEDRFFLVCDSPDNHPRLVIDPNYRPGEGF